VKPLSLLMLFWLSLIWMASLTRRSMYPDALSNTYCPERTYYCYLLSGLAELAGLAAPSPFRGFVFPLYRLLPRWLSGSGSAAVGCAAVPLPPPQKRQWVLPVVKGTP
jgi:hypothetical protein